MTNGKKNRLTDAQKAFVVRELGFFGSPKQVSDALMEQFGVQLAPQNVEFYDPRKKAGQSLGTKWRELFQHTREEFLKHIADHIPEAHVAVRVQKLAKGARAFEGAGNYLAMATMLEKIAREIGGSYTNRHEHSGRDGKPIQLEDVTGMTDTQIDAELERLWAKTRTAQKHEPDKQPH